MAAADEKKKIQNARMWRYFLNAAADLIEEKGMSNIKIREIADRAGYTSSTVYNYFQNLSHLKFFAAMRYTTAYFQDLPNYMKKGENTIDEWLYGWECFCRHSFQYLEVYSLLYIENLGVIPEKMNQMYYEVYANELINLSEEVQSIITHHNIATRSTLFIQKTIEEGFIDEADLDYIANLTMLIWTGMMTNLLNLRKNVTKEEAAKNTMHYISRSIIDVVIPEKKHLITYEYGRG
ncbi:TetR/AcrR family transcriptional regulator [Salibacterium qingdaonense]|uniref:Transcriptional regulator, TetR family n=1 Tax=Salibacterium qingdaonense TaxID=266892 RepID=A0A1I4KP80_9BACI|nr:TetR/AcrR family transcriptional regulator [Salibacterium qingdaonense]SFL80359.1 transcriptional regulator, TetR family [Salibacterium qingdaonense]